MESVEIINAEDNVSKIVDIQSDTIELKQELDSSHVPEVNDKLSKDIDSTVSKASTSLRDFDSTSKKLKTKKVPLQIETANISGSSSKNSKHLNKVKQHVVSENQERINYLFQASSYLNNINNANNFKNMSASLGSMAMAIGRKCVLRLSPGLKRQMCKGCGSAILPAVSSKYRLRNNRLKHLVVTCNKCKTIKRFSTNPNYVLWSDNAQSHDS